VLVYRIETKGSRHEGRGWSCTSKYTSHWCNLPNPYDDQPDGYDEKFKLKDRVCGADSLEQFHTWWKEHHIPAIKKRRKARVAILEIHSKHVTKLKTQVVFDRNKARIVGTLSSKCKPIINKPLKGYP